MSQIWMVICSHLRDHLLLGASLPGRAWSECWVKEGGSAPRWNITLVIYITDDYLGMHFQAHIETLHYIDSGIAALKYLLL